MGWNVKRYLNFLSSHRLHKALAIGAIEVEHIIIDCHPNSEILCVKRHMRHSTGLDLIQPCLAMMYDVLLMFSPTLSPLIAVPLACS